MTCMDEDSGTHTVAGVTSRWFLSGFGSSRVSAARIARSVQSRRGLGFPRRRTATSWRNTSSSAFLDAVERASSTSQPAIRVTIR